MSSESDAPGHKPKDAGAEATPPPEFDEEWLVILGDEVPGDVYGNQEIVFSIRTPFDNYKLDWVVGLVRHFSDIFRLWGKRAYSVYRSDIFLIFSAL